jgi:hypothetical protein
MVIIDIWQNEFRSQIIFKKFNTDKNFIIKEALFYSLFHVFFSLSVSYLFNSTNEERN